MTIETMTASWVVQDFSRNGHIVERAEAFDTFDWYIDCLNRETAIDRPIRRWAGDAVKVSLTLESAL